MNTLTLSKYIQAEEIQKIDFLKIDTEGYDLFVLKGAPWEKLKPEIVLCEFEDFKSKRLGILTHDMIDFLISYNYHIVVSEWFPVIEYGMEHTWKGFFLLPYTPSSERVWGNLIAIQSFPSYEIFLRYLYKRYPEKCFFT